MLATDHPSALKQAVYLLHLMTRLGAERLGSLVVIQTVRPCKQFANALLVRHPAAASVRRWGGIQRGWSSVP